MSEEKKTLKIGILALQGAFREHGDMLKRFGIVDVVEVRKPEQLDSLHGLIIPGGESTAFAIIGRRLKMFDALKKWIESKKPTWGTCAGLIVLANNVDGQKKGGQNLVGGLDVVVRRNYFGAQIASFEADISPPPSWSSKTPNFMECDRSPTKRFRTSDGSAKSSIPFPGVFIRAPAIVKIIEGEELAAVEGKDGETVPIAVRQGHILGTSFHPELTDDHRWHGYFVEMVEKKLST